MIDEELSETRSPEIVWDFYCKTKFGNNVYIGRIVKTNEFKACTDAAPWFHVPSDKFDVVEKQIKFMLAAYGEHLKELTQQVFAVTPEV